jgi:hypothetical protein
MGGQVIPLELEELVEDEELDGAPPVPVPVLEPELELEDDVVVEPLPPVLPVEAALAHPMKSAALNMSVAATAAAERCDIEPSLAENRRKRTAIEIPSTS